MRDNEDIILHVVLIKQLLSSHTTILHHCYVNILNLASQLIQLAIPQCSLAKTKCIDMCHEEWSQHKAGLVGKISFGVKKTFHFTSTFHVIVVLGDNFFPSKICTSSSCRLGFTRYVLIDSSQFP